MGLGQWSQSLLSWFWLSFLKYLPYNPSSGPSPALPPVTLPASRSNFFSTCCHHPQPSPAQEQGSSLTFLLLYLFLSFCLSSFPPFPIFYFHSVLVKAGPLKDLFFSCNSWKISAHAIKPDTHPEATNQEERKELAQYSRERLALQMYWRVSFSPGATSIASEPCAPLAFRRGRPTCSVIFLNDPQPVKASSVEHLYEGLEQCNVSLVCAFRIKIKMQRGFYK